MSGCPIMFLSDSVDSKSGLGRITRDIAVHASRLPEFRVATLGRGGLGSRQLPWPQYHLRDDEWGQLSISQAWRDFAGDEKGVLMTIWDPSRIRWQVDGRGQSESLVRFMNEGRFVKWLYCPIDATGPGNKIPGVLADTMSKFDRVLMYGMWAEELAIRSLPAPHKDLTWLPHGVNMNAFQPRDKDGARLVAGLASGSRTKVVGVVMTNQLRKDWGMVAVVAHEVKKRRPDVRWWWHVDDPMRHWNLYALMQDYGLADVVEVTWTGQYSDVDLSWRYSSCDLTILPSAEGFGLPIIESLACGVPVVHGTYAGGAELISDERLKVEPVTYRLEGAYNSLRPVWTPESWVEKVEWALDEEWDVNELRGQVSHLDWTNLGMSWQRWLKAGVGL